MRPKRLPVIAAVLAVTLGLAPTALADNDATGSVGAVQTGTVAVTPTVDTSSASVSAPTSIGGSGDNTASGSVGSVQVGGGNTSTNSTGSVQVSSVSST